MKKMLICAIGIALLAMCMPAQAKVWDDLSWWGQSGATPEPVQDPVRSGYWWWPTTPASNVNDMELWGNRGVVYNAMYELPAPTPAPPAPPAPVEPTPPPRVTRAVPVLNHVLFDFDKAELKPEGRAEADKVINWLKEYPQDTVVIEGHTCNIGPADYNMALGQRRADAVRRYLVNQNISADRITTRSYGLEQPAVPNTSPANRRLNRRAVFNISLGDS